VNGEFKVIQIINGTLIRLATLPVKDLHGKRGSRLWDRSQHRAAGDKRVGIYGTSSKQHKAVSTMTNMDVLSIKQATSNRFQRPSDFQLGKKPIWQPTQGRI
jgi:hypothetical protein